jgi:hypothetical protein
MKKLKRPELPKPSPSVSDDPAARAKLAPSLKRASPKVHERRQARNLYPVHTTELRRLAMMEYVTDPDSRSVEWHHNRPDRDYHKLVGYSLFERWSLEDTWADRRKKYWDEVVERVQTQFAERAAIQRIREMERLALAVDSISEYLLPKRDKKTGQVIRHPLGHEHEGLPEYPLQVPSFNKTAEVFVNLYDKLVKVRGELSAARPEFVDDDDGDTSLGPAAGRTNLSTDEIRALSKMLLHRRQPELLVDAIETDAEETTKHDDDEVG